MKNQALLNYFIFTCFLVAGYIVSSKFYRSDYGLTAGSFHTIPSREINSVKSLNHDQQSILLIGTPEIGAFNCDLERIWIASYFPMEPTIWMTPTYPPKNIKANVGSQLY